MSMHDEMMERFQQLVQTHGWAAQSVFPDVAGKIPGFTYTMGNALKGRPDFIVFGLGPENSHYILQTVQKRYIDNESHTFVEGTVHIDTEIAKNLPVALVLATEEKYSKFMFATDRFYKSVDFTGPRQVIQIVLPDAMGNFPWDTQYNKDGSMVKSGMPMFVSCIEYAQPKESIVPPVNKRLQ